MVDSSEYDYGDFPKLKIRTGDLIMRPNAKIEVVKKNPVYAEMMLWFPPMSNLFT
jgi:hypothetical protein